MLLPTLEQRQVILEEIGYKPTEGQLPILFDEHRIVEVVGGWRSGKSSITARRLVSQYWLGDLYWILGADYELCRPEFGYLVDDFTKLGLIKNCHFPNRDQCILEIAPNIIIETKSSKYPERIAAKAPDGIIIVEAAQVTYDMFLRCQGRLVEKDGWMFMSGTLETSLDWYSDKFREYQSPDNSDGGISFSLPSWSNTYIFPKGREDSKIVQQQAICGSDLFAERYGGVPIRPRGMVVPEFKSTLHTGSYAFNPNHGIYLAIDPGYYPSVYSVLFIQFIGDQVYVIDEIYEQHLTTEQIITMAKKKTYYSSTEGGAIDIAAQQHQGQKPVWEIWKRETGLNLNTTRVRPVSAGVNRLRTFLIPHPITGEVQVHIDTKCRGLISELGGCKSPIEGKGIWKMQMDRVGNVLSEEPEDKNCDSSKALIYAIVARFGLGVRPRKPAVSYIDF